MKKKTPELLKADLTFSLVLKARLEPTEVRNLGFKKRPSEDLDWTSLCFKMPIIYFHLFLFFYNSKDN